ncbi:MAG TPA: FAD:protein FMN transferase [Nevskiaceae bacterium]|nr:FAD:protein FMN transferase [Nevskiaceae bacterium]
MSAQFEAMASPCTVLADGADDAELARLVEIARRSALRIEHKWSRYRDDNIVHRINHAQGEAITVDDETARLIDYAALLWRESERRFDITSGVLRRAWRFDGSDRVPDRETVAALLPLVGWDKVTWRSPQLRLAPGMEIDFGGIGKEYAVDVTLRELVAATDKPVLVNFGGDLAASQPPRDGPWRVGIDSGAPDRPAPLIKLDQGAIATSGDARRFLLKDGVRYPHVLDPRTGWPVMDAPRAVTVAATTCIEAGTLSTLAMLRGAEAETFLQSRGCDHHVVR